MSGTEKTIDNFGGWEDASQQHDFFGETHLVKDVITTVEKDDIVDSPEKEKQKQEEIDEQALIDEQFKEFEESAPAPASKAGEEEDEDEGPKGKTEKAVKIDAKSTLEFLKDKGFVDYEDDPENPITEEEAEGLLEDSWDSSIDKAVEESIKNLPQPVKDLIRYATKGGDVGELISKMASHAVSGLSKNSDIEDEAVQILAVTADLKNQGHDEEYISTQIEFLKEKEKLASMGKKAFDKIIAEQEAEISQEATRQATLVESKKKQAREYRANITTHINSLEEVNGFPINKEEKAVLPTYISEPSVELQDGGFVSEMQADLFKVMADKDKIVLLAKLLKSDFDFSALERKKGSEISRGFKDRIQNSEKDKGSNTSGGGSSQTKKRSLVEMLGDDD